MHCPVDGTTLALAERAGVEIDYCPQCRGVWLDRGELDRILERSARGGNDGIRGHDAHHGHDHDGHERRHHDDQPRRRRGSAFGVLSDLLGGGSD